jgi:hypothetical protein
MRLVGGPVAVFDATTSASSTETRPIVAERRNPPESTAFADHLNMS